MLEVSICLYLIASSGVLAMGLKYIRAKPPLDYHASIMKDQNPSAETLVVLGALYKVMGGSFLALGAVLAIIAVFGVWNDLLWAKLAALTGALVAGGFAAMVPRSVETSTGVRTPWRIAGTLTVLVSLAFALSTI